MIWMIQIGTVILGNVRIKSDHHFFLDFNSNTATIFTVMCTTEFWILCCTLLVTSTSSFSCEAPSHSSKNSSLTPITLPTRAPRKLAISAAFCLAFFRADRLACLLCNIYIYIYIYIYIIVWRLCMKDSVVQQLQFYCDREQTKNLPYIFQTVWAVIVHRLRDLYAVI